MRRERPPLPPGFGTIWTSVAIDLVGWGIVLPILPLYGERFTTSPVTLDILVASFSAMQLLFAPVLGRVSDRYGRKPVLVVSLAGTAIGSLVMGLAPALWALFLGRIIDGISGGSVSTAYAAVADMAEPEDRARLIGLLGAAFGVGFVAGPAIGALAALFGHRVPLFVAAAIAGVNAVVALRRLPETRPTDTVEHLVEPPVMTPVLRRLVVVVFVATSAFTAFEATFALLGQRRFDLTMASTSAVFVGIGVLLVFFQGGMVHPAVARFGELGTVRLGLVLNGAGFVLVAVARSWFVLVPAVALLTAGQGLLAPSLTAMVSARARQDRRGSVLGLQQSVSALARFVGPIVGGVLFAHVGVGAPYVAGAVLVLLAVALLPDVRSEVTAG